MRGFAFGGDPVVFVAPFDGSKEMACILVAALVIVGNLSEISKLFFSKSGH